MNPRTLLLTLIALLLLPLAMLANAHDERSFDTDVSLKASRGSSKLVQPGHHVVAHGGLFEKQCTAQMQLLVPSVKTTGSPTYTIYPAHAMPHPAAIFQSSEFTLKITRAHPVAAIDVYLATHRLRI